MANQICGDPAASLAMLALVTSVLPPVLTSVIATDAGVRRVLPLHYRIGRESAGTSQQVSLAQPESGGDAAQRWSLLMAPFV